MPNDDTDSREQQEEIGDYTSDMDEKIADLDWDEQAIHKTNQHNHSYPFLNVNSLR